MGLALITPEPGITTMRCKNLLCWRQESQYVIVRNASKTGPVRNGKVLSTTLWISTYKGELGRQDKFGRGVMDRLVKDIATPSTLKDSIQLIVHYEGSNPCLNSPCTPFCVLIPGGCPCSCFDSTILVQSGGEMWDATEERTRPSPFALPLPESRGLHR
ncbi:hypothetical protein DAPPUDRAFT_246514 [Daphnia pulex]|uniref:Uncharacterized protein n=1 Tax=Daphnia pulex TaxID=6669 RepID=E9GQQ3_DAPPU|nr:hypothetical protein DAPPUDRAFT_246514 [Daphnia pulex]|eukprot:EFX78153.1 hypothetical protein DAPPUDRAFT_246514 [Daphnia pulex]